MIRVLVFGVFDGLHEGHRAMLKEAKSLGDYLVVAVAPDSVVQELKGKVCHNRSGMRIQGVRQAHIADEVALGDKLLSSWHILKKYKPDIIALGYDQQELKDSLEAHFENLLKKPKIVMLKPHKPEIYKSSILNS